MFYGMTWTIAETPRSQRPERAVPPTGRTLLQTLTVLPHLASVLVFRLYLPLGQPSPCTFCSSPLSSRNRPMPFD